MYAGGKPGGGMGDAAPRSSRRMKRRSRAHSPLIGRTRRTPTQQVGVKLDVECPNTIAGLREGRDETLDCALRELSKNP